jgi:hypothetical protein
MKEEISAWRKGMGFDYIKRPAEDKLAAVFEVSSQMLDNIPLAELDDMLLILSNYYVFLGSEMGRISASIVFLTDSLKHSVAKKSSRMEGGTAMERHALIVAKDEELSVLNRKLIAANSKREMLQPIYDSIKIKIDSLKRVYFRRTSEAKAQ